MMTVNQVYCVQGKERFLFILKKCHTDCRNVHN